MTYRHPIKTVEERRTAYTVLRYFRFSCEQARVMRDWRDKKDKTKDIHKV